MLGAVLGTLSLGSMNLAIADHHEKPAEEGKAKKGKKGGDKGDKGGEKSCSGEKGCKGDKGGEKK
jgi:hypothetical protein